jgi:V/A-type H+/Na+-transporting ATPase subunit E
MEEKGVDELCGKIAEDSAKEAAEILRRAEEKLASRLAEAKSEAEKAAADTLRRAQRDAAVASQRISSRLQLELRKMALQGREARISEVMLRIRKQIDALRSRNDYPELLMRLIVEGTLELGGRDVEIAVAAPDRKIVTDAFMQRLSEELRRAGIEEPSVTLSSREIKGTGAIVRARSGRVEVNNTLEGRIARKRRELRMLIAKVLFAEE